MRVNQEPGFVVHNRPYSETSWYVELFTLDHGRLTVIAKGARQQKSKFRGVLRPFQELVVSWSGKGEIPILTQAEPARTGVITDAGVIYCGFYLNELILRLLHRHEGHPDLFRYYAQTVERLVQGANPEVELRLFEKTLLSELGYAISFKEASNGEPIERDVVYKYIPQFGAVRDDGRQGEGIRISGAALLALMTGEFNDQKELSESKKLMRILIAQQLNHRTLHSRKLFLAPERRETRLREAGN